MCKDLTIIHPAEPPPPPATQEGSNILPAVGVMAGLVLVGKLARWI